MDTRVTVFEIDAEDRIKHVDNAWLAFAKANGGEALLGDKVLGHNLWEYVAGSELRLLYRGLLEQVRKLRRPIETPFRCDAPDEERQMRLRIEPIDDGNALRIVSTTVRCVKRDPVHLLDSSRRRSESERDTLSICSLCKAIHRETEGWQSLDRAVVDLNLTSNAVLPTLSHGICPDCVDHFEEAMSQSR